ncbi:MAG: metal-dependent hydrolase [Desulfobacca sp.]|nr:metal-dependent hydrolase [Desulfobacca sp.]
MLGRNHVIVGLGLYLAADYALGTGGPRSDLVNCLTAAALGSLTPDLDSPHSYLGRRLWPVSRTVSAWARHRGPTHSLLACLLVGLGVAAGSKMYPGWSPYFIAFAIGYVSHLLADWCTTEGVPLLWPNNKRFRSPLNFRTGGMVENLFSLALGSGLGYWFYQSFR